MYEARDHLLIYSEYADPESHHHSAAHIMVSMNEEIEVVTEEATIKCNGIVIPSGVLHTAKTYGNSVLVFLFDNTTSVSRQISSVRTMTHDSVCKIKEEYQNFVLGKRDISSYDAFVQCVLECNGIASTGLINIDDRIQYALAYIQSRLQEKITCAEVAESIYLSEGRFSHLFRKQVGMTFASYLIYQRVIKAYTAIINGESVTEAALDAGFSSSAHFADVSKKLFGLSATGIKKELEFHKIAEI